MWGAPEPLQTCADIDKIMRRVGVREDLLETQLDEPIWDERLERATAEAADRGVFGAPCIFIGEDMFFGNDRLDFVRAHLALAA
jgi:2-hydroxychromene-2-carboxylate isomerase